MIIITGVGRCGTSLMAKFLKESGLDIGSDKWYKKVNAGYENKETLQINTELINHYVKDYKIDFNEIKERIRALEFDAVKDPQFLTDSRIIKTWHEARQDLKIIFMYRNPYKVVESMKKVPEWNSPVFRLFPEMIVQKQDEFIVSIHDLKIPYKEFKYDWILNKSKFIVESLSDWLKCDLEAFNSLVE